MTIGEWKELEGLTTAERHGTLTKADTKRINELLDMTTNEVEHPDLYDGPCYCRECMSYG